MNGLAQLVALSRREAKRRKVRPLILRTMRRMLPRLREVARSMGYALAVHGSLSKDLDLVAIPWTHEACPCATKVAAAILRAAWEMNGNKGWLTVDEGVGVIEGEAKPHGRRAWALNLCGDPHYWIDLSVLPCL